MGQPLSWWKEYYAHTIWQNCDGLTLIEINEMLSNLIVEAQKNHDLLTNAKVGD